MSEHGEFRYDPEEERFRPDFDINIVRIEHLADSPEGFTLNTLRSEPRDTGEKPLDWLFDNEHEVKVSHPSNRLDVKIGTQALLREGSNLKAVITPAYFYEYKNPEMARNPEVPKPFGTALALFTTEEDGSSKLIVQHRGENNFFYGDIPGASVAGIWNAAWKVVDGDRVKVEPVDTDSAKTNIYREMREEVGLLPSDLEAFTITGYCKDKVKDHPELTMSGRTNLSAAQVMERAEGAKRAGKYQTSHQFAERVTAIPGTTDAIETLLTEVRSPIPPTHVAAYVAAWYGLQMQEVAAGRLSLEDAHNLRDRLAQRVEENYAHIDDLVAFYYRQNPSELHNTGFRENQPRNERGYAPAYFPKHQGLPHAIDELVRTGLILPPQAS